MAGWLRESNGPGDRIRLGQALAPGATRPRTGGRGRAPDHRQRMPRVVPIVNNWQVVRLDKRMSGDPMVAAAAAMLGLALESGRDQHLRRRLLRRRRRAARRQQPLCPPLRPAAAGQCLLVAHHVCGREPALRSQRDQPLLVRRPHEGHRVWRGRIHRDLPPARGTDRSEGAGELAAGSPGALLPRHAALLAAGRDPDRRLAARPAGDAAWPDNRNAEPINPTEIAP
jgi:hypothetical protein